MGYTIGEAAKKSGLTPHTLRYYDREGLLPFVNRLNNGLRSFNDRDIEWLSVITCLKGTGMSIKDIKDYIDWCQEGGQTLEKRRDMFVRQKEIVEMQMRKYQQWLNKIDFKIWYYNTALEAGAESVHEPNSCKELEEEFKRIHKIDTDENINANIL